MNVDDSTYSRSDQEWYTFNLNAQEKLVDALSGTFKRMIPVFAEVEALQLVRSGISVSLVALSIFLAMLDSSKQGSTRTFSRENEKRR